MALITYTNKDDTQPEGDPRKHFVDNDANEIKAVVNTNRGDSDSSLSTLTGSLSSHTGNTSNPHSVTKTQVGLPNVDNTSDADKPVSTAQSTAIGVVQSDINAHEALTNNPHSVTKTQIGLDQVDNTSDANKPVSTAQSTAINAKVADAINN